MTYLATLKPGPKWWPGRPTRDQGLPIDRHIAAMLRLRDDGLLLAGGTLPSGAVALLATTDPHTARICIASDPAVAAGLFDAAVEPLTRY